MSQIFISYASEDRERAKVLAQALEQRGFGVWWDRKIPFGKAYDEVIAESLARAKCVLVLWTDMSVESRWVRSEASEAAGREILIPVLMQRDLKIPLEFKLLQAADLCDWQGDPEYPEFKALLAQIETMLAHATTATPEQTTPPRGHERVDAGTARKGPSKQSAGAWQPGTDTQDDPKAARRKKIRHLVGFIVIPSLVLLVAAAVAMTLRLPTRLQLDVVVDRVTFTLGGNQALDLPVSALSFSLLSIENFDRAAFRPKRLRVQDDAGRGPKSGAPKWRDVSGRGEIVLNGIADERPLLIVERAGGDAGAQLAGRLQPLSGKPRTRVTVEARSGSSPRLVLRMDGQELRTNLLPNGDLDLSTSHATIEGAGDLASDGAELSLQVALPEDDPYVELQGGRRFFVVTAAFVAPAPPLVGRAEVQDIEFLKQGAGGSIESALVGNGEVSYPGQPGIERKTLAPGDLVGVGELEGAYITRLELRADGAGMDLRLDGVARRAQLSSGGVKQDLRVTAFDWLWHNKQAAVLASIAAWALAVFSGAYRLYKDFAVA